MQQREGHTNSPNSSDVGQFEVGSDIQETSHGPSVDTEVSPMHGKSHDAPRNQVVGAHDGVVGDADVMTSGSSGEQTPDDTAMRNLSRATKHGHSADEMSDLNTLNDDRSIEHDAR